MTINILQLILRVAMTEIFTLISKLSFITAFEIIVAQTEMHKLKADHKSKYFK